MELLLANTVFCSLLLLQHALECRELFVQANVIKVIDAMCYPTKLAKSIY